MSLRKSLEIGPRASEAPVSVRRQFQEGLGHQTNMQSANRDRFRRPLSPRSCRPDSQHKALPCETHENAEVAVDEQGRVHLRRSAVLLASCLSMVEVVWQVLRRE